jgi:hypothetical protein
MINLASILSICAMTTPGLHCASFNVSPTYYSFQLLKKRTSTWNWTTCKVKTPQQYKSSKTATDPYVHRLPNIDWQAAGVIEVLMP